LLDRVLEVRALDRRMGLAPAASAVPEVLRKTQVTPTKGSPSRADDAHEWRQRMDEKVNAAMVGFGLEPRRDERAETLRPELRGHGTLTPAQARRMRRAG
jgi:hypothetical protein